MDFVKSSSAYDEGYNDWMADVPKPLQPQDREYMMGWEDAMLDSEAGDTGQEELEILEKGEWMPVGDIT